MCRAPLQAEQQQQAQQQQQQQQQQAALGLLAAALGPLHAFATQLQPQQAVGLVAALNPLVTTAVAALGTLLGGVPQVLPAAGLQLPALGGVPLPPPLPGQLLAALGGQLLLQLAGVPSVPSSVPLPALGGHEDGSPPWPDVLADANLRPGDTPTTSSQAQALVRGSLRHLVAPRIPARKCGAFSCAFVAPRCNELAVSFPLTHQHCDGSLSPPRPNRSR